MQLRASYRHLALLLLAVLFATALGAPDAAAEAEALAEAEPQNGRPPTPPAADPQNRPDTPSTKNAFFNGGGGGDSGTCRIITSSRNRRIPCRWCPWKGCPVRSYVWRPTSFSCWYYSGDFVNNVGYWDKISGGGTCWVNESNIQDGCWRSLPKCRDRF